MAGYRRRLIGTDLLIVLAAVLTAALFQPGNVFHRDSGSVMTASDWLFAAAVAALWLTVLAVEGVWETETLGTGLTEYRRILLASLTVFAIVGIFGFLTLADPARSYLLIALPIGSAGLLLGHGGWRRWLTARRRSGQCLRGAVVVGDPDEAVALCAAIRDRTDAGYRVTGVCTASGGRRQVGGFPVVGDLTDVPAAAARAGAGAIAVAASPSFDRDRVSTLAWRLEGTGIRLLIAPEVGDVAGPRVHTRPIGGLALLRVSEARLDGGRAVAKNTLDVAVATIALLVLSPLMLLAAIAVRLADGGPVLHRQDLVGRGGTVFAGWTFRCAPQGAKARPGRAGQDPGFGDGSGYRVLTTTVGRVLRRTGLEESPRLFNVLARQMSVVGPEPLAASDSGVPDSRRPPVRPGITGPWRVFGRFYDPAADRARLDAFSMEDWSVVGDLVIMARSVKLVVTGEYPRSVS